jgi:anti-sigma-K factor RskA
MRYDTPELRERLAGDYVLGTMPRRARHRFERLMAADPALARLVGDWTDRLGPLDDATPTAEPPARVWRAIEGRIAATAAVISAPSPPVSWFGALALWRGLAAAAGAAAAGLAIYVAAFTGRAPAPTVIAVLAGQTGAPGWVALAGPKPGEVSLAAAAPQAEPKPHAFELWGLAGGPPRPLGLLPQQAGSVVILRAADLPPPGGVLAVSLEPPGGSPVAGPSGPVLYQGKVLIGRP